jgi:hypothetical protein
MTLLRQQRLLKVSKLENAGQDHVLRRGGAHDHCITTDMHARQVPAPAGKAGHDVAAHKGAVGQQHEHSSVGPDAVVLRRSRRCRRLARGINRVAGLECGNLAA